MKLTYNEHESILYALKLHGQLTSKEGKVDYMFKFENYSFSMTASHNNNIRLFDVKYWEEVPQEEELKAIINDLSNKLNVFNKIMNTNICEINLVVVGRLFVLRTIQVNINAFCEVKNTVIRFFDKDTLREVLDYPLMQKNNNPWKIRGKHTLI